MKNRNSLLATLLIIGVMLGCRLHYSDVTGGKPLKITDWDAFGYYMYLPSAFIYQDLKKQDWVSAIDAKYKMTGGDFYQAQQADNGNMVCKYLGGVAILQAPFFFIAHWIAKHSSYPPDGFSAPYQYSLAFGALLYAFLALLLLRKVLLAYFSDRATAITLLLVCLASNYIEYGAIETGQSHCYIFFLYAVILYLSWQWHERPRLILALLTGYVIGLATMSRPTEAIMLFIPLLWGLQHKAAAKEKWRQVGRHKLHIAAIGIGGLLGILPQLLYWKLVTGSFMYDVGSKWYFFNPFFRVLFGFEKGWFIYTPVTILFVLGLFFIKRYPFQKSVITFCLLNIWIIIAWDDWRYGGSYSTRALVQSYPVFALAVAAVTERVLQQKWRIVFYIAGGYLLLVNLFQVWQYNRGILHFNDMNRLYYSHIYLDPAPSPLDMSLMDNPEFFGSSKTYSELTLVRQVAPVPLQFPAGVEGILLEGQVVKGSWIKIETQLTTPASYWNMFLHAEIRKGNKVKRAFIRLFQPVGQATHRYGLYMHLPRELSGGLLKIYLTAPDPFTGTVGKLQVWSLDSKR